MSHLLSMCEIFTNSTLLLGIRLFWVISFLEQVRELVSFEESVHLLKWVNRLT